jgi:hypothetical protein
MSSQIPKSRRKELSVLKNSHARLTAYLSALKVTATSTAGYSYRPLNRDRKEIRLLTLEPGYRGTTIRCTLKHAFLDECPIPHYETISYTCGDPALRSRIMLHDIPTDVPTSSEVVLRRMRRPTARRVLWIDSICIDQENTAERGHQVGMMYEIYANTSRNLVWLGHDIESTQQAIVSISAVLIEMAKECNGLGNLGTILRDGDAIGHFAKTSLCLNERVIASLVRFYDSPWFSRLWIVQEVSLAAKSVCYRGKHSIPMLDVLRMARLISKKIMSPLWHYPLRVYKCLKYASYICDLADREHGVYWQFQQETTFLSLLVGMRELETVDPRDHIFALLGLWRQLSRSTDQSTWLEPDYSLRVCEVFKNATRYAITESGHLGALRSVFESDHDFGKWPSWVPRWDHEPDFGTTTDPSPFRFSFNSHNDVEMNMIEFVDHAASLCIHGLVLDVVAGVLPASNFKMTARRLRKRLAEIEAHIEALSCSKSWIRAPIGNVEAKVASTLCAGGELWNLAIDDEEALEGYRAYKQHLTDYETFPSVNDTATDQEILAERFGNNSAAAVNRAVFNTKDGYVGLGPQAAEPGDLLVILYGSEYPAVLRPHEDENCFFFVGLAYVYGIMDDEAVREYKADGVEDTLFCIV